MCAKHSPMSLPKVLAIVGPTSSGKTALSLELAQQFNGEIINADARQFYRGFDIGTGKPDLKQAIPHHLFDVLDPAESWSVTEWKKEAEKLIQEIAARGHLPIIVGGTGLYIQSLIDNMEPPAVTPQSELREEISKKSLSELQAWLEEVDPKSALFIDMQNPRRIQRALEVAITTGQSFVDQQSKGEKSVDALQIGIDWPRPLLNERIDAAIDRMLKDGWMEETKRLVEQGIPEDAPAFSSIGYRDILDFLKNKITQSEMVHRIKNATHQYAKRQMTWFKRDPRIKWLSDQSRAKNLVEAWIKAR